jgi:hypothetical protein
MLNAYTMTWHLNKRKKQNFEIKKKVGKNRESNIIAQYWLLASNWNFMVSFDKVN